MSLEIEAKMKVERFDEVIARLREAGAQRIGAVVETNTFFDTPDRRLTGQDKGLRLRRSREPASGAERFVLTFKGPQQPGELKTREEVETEVSDAQAAARILAALGYVPTLSFEKKRESWTLGGCKIELDELPLLGKFIEIEGPGEEAVWRLRQTLRLANNPIIKTGYIALLSAHLSGAGRVAAEIRFD